MSIARVRQQAWNEALLILLVEQPGLSGTALLEAVIDEACDAIARLREHGLVNSPDEDDLHSGQTR